MYTKSDKTSVSEWQGIKEENVGSCKIHSTVFDSIHFLLNRRTGCNNGERVYAHNLSSVKLQDMMHVHQVTLHLLCEESV